MSLDNAFFLTWRCIKFSSATASGVLTFKLHLSGQSYLCLFFIFIFTQFKVSSLECLRLTQALPSNLSVLPKSIPGLTSLVWVCMRASTSTDTHTHTHTHTQTREEPLRLKSLFISCLITKQGNMQSLRTASGHLPIMHDLLLSRVFCFLHNLERAVCQERSFQNYNSWYYCNGKAKPYNWLNRKRNQWQLPW